MNGIYPQSSLHSVFAAAIVVTVESYNMLVVDSANCAVSMRMRLAVIEESIIKFYLIIIDVVVLPV